MKFGAGQSPKRTEDQRLLVGKGLYTDDMRPEGMLFGVCVRSPYGHARILKIDTHTARTMPGVRAIYTAQDLAAYAPLPCLVNFNPDAQTPRTVLAGEYVRFVGEDVAFVVAQSREQARAAAEAVEVDYEERPAIASIEEATSARAPQLWPHSPNNQPWVWESGDAHQVEKAFAHAHHITRVKIIQNRVAPTSMEARAALATYDPEHGYCLTAGTQGVANMHSMVSQVLPSPTENLRIITHDVGGGFGMKGFLYPEYILVLHAARDLGLPVKWTGERSEAFLTDTHGRDLISTAALALDREGLMLGLRVESWCNLGAYMSFFGSAIQTVAGGRMIGGVYRIPALYNRVTGVLSNTAPVDAYRGAGRPEACYITERLVDTAAREMGIAPEVLRRRNLLTPDELPHTSPLGVCYDLGNFPAVLDKAIENADWRGFEARKALSRAQGKRRGRGLCFYTEICAFAGTQEYADARFSDDDTLDIAVGTQSNGQGHETAYAQIAAAYLGLDIKRIRIHQGDTQRLELGFGTAGSRSLHFGAAAIVQTLHDLMVRATARAQTALHTHNVTYEDGLFKDVHSNRTIDLFALASLEPGALNIRSCWQVEKPTPTFPNGCHIAEVEIDVETGLTTVDRYTVVDDFGIILNPMLVEGQIHGGIAQGLGQALLENMVYGEGAQLMTASFMDYAIPRAEHMPQIAFESLGVPNPNNPLGVKGCGEAGTIGAMPALMNAITDALDGVWVDMPATPQTVWRALQRLQAA